MEEVPLAGGNVTSGLVRVGDTVRRPSTPASVAVDALLRHLERHNFEHAPRSLGFDDQGRHVLEYVPGDTAMPFTSGTDGDPAALSEIGRIIRVLHDILESFDPPSDAQWQCPIPSNGADLVIHNDLAPWNLIRDGQRLVFIDWDGAAPGTRLWDLSYAAHGFVPLQPTTDVDEAGRNLRALADGYGLDAGGRAALLDLLVPRTLSMYDLLARGHEAGTPPWAKLWAEGHGEVWRGDAAWIQGHQVGLTDWLARSSE